ncbi:MAG: phage collar protein [Alphaproteobacteria bacterium]
MIDNLNGVVSEALCCINPYKEFVFTKISSNWEGSNREPILTKENVTLKGKLQPLSLKDIKETGFNLMDYTPLRAYVSSDKDNISSLDILQQRGADTFTCDGVKYKVINQEDWTSQNCWKALYCYIIGKDDE